MTIPLQRCLAALVRPLEPALLTEPPQIDDDHCDEQYYESTRRKQRHLDMRLGIGAARRSADLCVPFVVTLNRDLDSP